MIGDRRTRLAISFADLALLLLGFFVLLQSSGARRDAVLSSVGQQFGAGPPNKDKPAAELRSAELFSGGEAMLTRAGRARISAIAAGYVEGNDLVEVTSSGQDGSAHRFDAWDLAAARIGAVARSLKASGIPEGRLLIRGLDQSSPNSGGQIIRIRITTPEAR